MKKFLLSMIALAAIFSFAACNDTETYKDLRDRELDSISSFLRNEKVKVISEEEFKSRFEKGVTPLTDVSKNEYVLFNSNGIYMQVIEEGCGNYIEKGETADVIVRFNEYNLSYLARISDDCLTLSNLISYYSYLPDKMTVSNNSGTFSGTFDTNSSLMAQTYNSSGYGGVSSTVPSGWLTPFTWIKVGRPMSDDEHIAHIRLLVPHSYGTTTASGNVNACLYEMYIQRGTR